MEKDYEMTASDAVADATGEHAPEGTKEDIKQDSELKAKRESMQGYKDNGCCADLKRAIGHVKGQ